VAELRAARRGGGAARAAALLELFAPALTAAQRDRARNGLASRWRYRAPLFPVESAALDRAAGGTFPSRQRNSQAGARTVDR